MPAGGGKYDAEVEYVYQQTQPEAALLIILGGNRGEGFSVKANESALLGLPAILRSVADGIDQDLRNALIGTPA